MLTGVRVLDFTQYLPGPYATLRLAEMGAEVLKIERPSGDPARLLSEGVVFRANNRNKETVFLQLKNDVDLQKAKQFVKSAEILIESFRPGVMKRLGLDYEKVKKINPSIIYLSLTGYGNDSPLSHLGSHDLNYIALSGLMSQMLDANDRPVHPTTTLADLVGGIATSEAILAAYINKLKTGEGTYIDLSLVDVAVGLQTNHLLYEQIGLSDKGILEISGDNISYNIYETKDGRYVTLAALEYKFWENFCNWARKENWLNAHLSAAIKDNDVYNEIKALFKSYTFSEWTKIAMEVDACIAPVLSINELKDHPYMKNRKLIFDTEWGDRQVRTTPFKSKRLSAPPSN